MVFAQLSDFDSLTQERQLRNGGNASQGFSAKSQCMQVVEVFNTIDFAGTVARTGSLQLISGDTKAIIGDTHEAQPTTAYFDAYFMGFRINGILDEFFDNRDGTFDNFTCCNAFRYILRKSEYGGARSLRNWHLR